MRSQIGIWAGVALSAAVVTTGLSIGYLSWGPVLFAVIGLAVAHRVGRAVAGEADRGWLPRVVTLGYAARLVGAAVHHYVVTVVYETGDSLGYHSAALDLAEQWRALQVPVAPGGSAGTRFVELVTGLIYAPVVPSMLIGYFWFATFSFLGCLLLYLAFRRSVASAAARRYALLLFFLPSMLFWPSTIGKEALMIFAIGLASYGAASLIAGSRVSSVAAMALGVAGMAAIRPHVAVLMVAALVVGLVFSRRSGSRLSPAPRVVIAVLTLVALWSLAALAMTRLGVAGTDESIEAFLMEQERLTQTGGSAVVGSPVRNPVDVPEATLRVLFRPLPHEAHNIQAMLSALEGTMLLGLVAWRLPTMLGRLSLLRSRPYLLYSSVFIAEFVVAFSSILNFGILARQRTQVIPFLLAVVVGIGWRYQEDDGGSGVESESFVTRSPSIPVLLPSHGGSRPTGSTRVELDP